jgi:hypothetical protein
VAGKQHGGQDANADFLALVERLSGAASHVRSRAFERAWTPLASCWLCAGWSQRQLSCCAPRDAVVRVHLSSDGWKPLAMEPTHIGAVSPLAARAIERAELDTGARFDMIEFHAFAVVPPGEVAFYFSVDGRFVLGDMEPHKAWRLCAAAATVPPPLDLVRPGAAPAETAPGEGPAAAAAGSPAAAPPRTCFDPLCVLREDGKTVFCAESLPRRPREPDDANAGKQAIKLHRSESEAIAIGVDGLARSTMRAAGEEDLARTLARCAIAAAAPISEAEADELFDADWSQMSSAGATTSSYLSSALSLLQACATVTTAPPSASTSAPSSACCARVGYSRMRASGSPRRTS